MGHHPHTLDTPHLALLDRLVRRMACDGLVTDDVRQVIDVLTSAADPDRADQLSVRPGEPPVLVERLAIWALHRTTEQAVAEATRVLDAAGIREMEVQLADGPTADADPPTSIAAVRSATPA